MRHLSKKSVLHSVRNMILYLRGRPVSRIAFVTEELAVYGKSGGIGAAVFELAVMLRDHGHTVVIYYTPIELPPIDRQKVIENAFEDRGISLEFVDCSKYSWQHSEAHKRAYAVYRHLKECKRHYDYIHIHDYKGLGFFCCTAKRQGLAFGSTTIVVQLHGPTRWTIHANRGLFTHRDQLAIDFLERQSIALADCVVSPSAYLIDWMRDNDFTLPSPVNTHVIKNVYSHCLTLAGRNHGVATKFDVTEIIFFGRHEARKGFITFCDALDIINEDLAANRVSVCFVGGIGEINGQNSGIYLTQRAKNWNFAFEFHIDFDRMASIKFLNSRNGAVVVIPSTEENSPYTVVEAIASGRAVVTSSRGGAKELIDPANHATAIVEMEPDLLANRLGSIITDGAYTTQFAETADAINSQWLAFHENNLSSSRVEPALHRDAPRVAVGITHFERPRKVIGAIMSVMRQTYSNIELVVVDDGSRSTETIEALPQIEKLIARAGGRLIRRENGYLGAARNTIAKATQSEYLIFLDDDDLLFPDAIDRLITVALHTDADIVNCLNLYLDVSLRGQYELCPESFGEKVSYVPIGGPLALAHLGNMFGAATALIKRRLFDELGGYTELKRVGYEDYEFYVRAAQKGAYIEILPEPLYLYEVGKPSMISATSFQSNKQRIVNALDIVRNPAEWLDAIELSAGIESIADQDNSVRWRMSISPQRDLLHKIVSTRGDLGAHVAALAEYAHVISAPHVADAWSAAVQKSATADETVSPTRRVKPIKLATERKVPLRTSESDDLAVVSELAGLIKLDRTEEAIQALTAALSRDGDISEAMIEFMHLISISSDVNSQLSGTVRSLIEAISDSFVAEELALRLQGAVASLLIAVGDISKAKSLIAEIDLAESDEYISSYEDLQHAFGESASSSALEHFHKYGQSEGRKGFLILARLAQDVGKRSGRQVKPWHVRHSLERVLSRSRTPTLHFGRVRR